VAGVRSLTGPQPSLIPRRRLRDRLEVRTYRYTASRCRVNAQSDRWQQAEEPDAEPPTAQEESPVTPAIRAIDRTPEFLRKGDAAREHARCVSRIVMEARPLPNCTSRSPGSRANPSPPRSVPG
jgi:hypothetical protein